MSNCGNGGFNQRWRGTSNFLAQSCTGDSNCMPPRVGDPDAASCHKPPPMLVQYNRGCAPYPEGSIVLDRCGCAWGHMNPAGEYHPPGEGTWRKVDLKLLTAFLINPEKVLIQYLANAMSCPEITGQMVFACPDQDPAEIQACAIVRGHICNPNW